ncbi:MULTISPECIES: sce7726 family protein [Enterobacterales]|uniref:sce7726 family protein n=1 Tax=Enterobacterales TaxID=91347 RepID=UPI0008FCEF93|nr:MULTISPECIES: sce7726 family protein [Enterobacterales]KAA0262308.1 protein cII [Hafnia alvei]MBD9985902.1 sce7726 family protein [Citrobacter portucalensis]MBE0034626.1 sce7726 family protein [Citrobacter portucalensis]MBE0037698.1 sce7726 family protein [Citrobacter portucalensis]MBE0042993.1 sce7726 family protein [Citrobacter portucalensis]
MKEIEIKKILIESLITDKDNILSSEFRFNFGTRRADVICMTKDDLIAFEIKGAGDNTSRLEEQIDSYRKYFDLCYIVCEKCNLQNIRKKTPNNIGILVINDESITQVRKARNIKKHDKITLASTIDIRTLRKMVSNKKIKSKHELCELFSAKRKLKEVRKISRCNLFMRINNPYKIFLSELGSKVHSDDILTLTRMSSLELI